ncbi:MAG TPA: ABC transporter permease subunit, partial [Methylomirabilota bacterium]|nr:ABC transporter permease subunit [Methylomirabilota bacterium]
RRQNPLLFIPPSKIGPALGRLVRLESYPTLPAELGLTVVEVLVAYGLAVALGLALGFLLGLPRHVGEIYEPILSALYAIPSVVWYPSLMLFFGLGPASKIAFGVLLGFFPVVLAVLAGIRSVDRHLLTVARALGAGAGACFLKVMLPAMSGTLFAGLRAGLALTVVGVIVGEVLGARGGLGHLINHAYGFLRTADYAALAVLALVLVVLVDGVAALVEARARRWST